MNYKIYNLALSLLNTCQWRQHGCSMMFSKLTIYFDAEFVESKHIRSHFCNHTIISAKETQVSDLVSQGCRNVPSCREVLWIGCMRTTKCTTHMDLPLIYILRHLEMQYSMFWTFKGELQFKMISTTMVGWFYGV